MTRSLLEGVGYGMAVQVKLLREQLGLPVDRLRMAGGGSRSSLWRQILADAAAAPTVLTNAAADAPAYGVALLAGVGAGVWSSVEEATAGIEENSRQEPDEAATKRHARRLEQHDRLYQALPPKSSRVWPRASDRSLPMRRAEPDAPAVRAFREARRAVNRFGDAAGRGIRVVATAPLRRPPAAARHRTEPGATPGMTPEQLAKMKTAGHTAVITRTDYGPDLHDIRTVGAADDLHRPPPEGVAVRWIHVDRVDDPAALAGLAKRYGLHPLAMEDVVHTNQRSKAELFDSDDPENLRLFLVARMVRLQETAADVEHHRRL